MFIVNTMKQLSDLLYYCIIFLFYTLLSYHLKEKTHNIREIEVYHARPVISGANFTFPNFAQNTQPNACVLFTTHTGSTHES